MQGPADPNLAAREAGIALPVSWGGRSQLADVLDVLGTVHNRYASGRCQTGCRKGRWRMDNAAEVLNAYVQENENTHSCKI